MTTWRVQEGAGEKRKAGEDEANESADAKKAKTEGDKKEEDKDKDVTDEYVMVAREEATNEDVFHKEEVCPAHTHLRFIFYCEPYYSELISELFSFFS